MSDLFSVVCYVHRTIDEFCGQCDKHYSANYAQPVHLIPMCTTAQSIARQRLLVTQRSIKLKRKFKAARCLCCINDCFPLCAYVIVTEFVPETICYV